MEKVAGFWAQGARKLIDQTYMLPQLPQAGLIPAVERYLEFVQRMAEMNRDLTVTWVQAASALSGVACAQAPAEPAEEVRGSGVRVCCLAPGATQTGFAAQAGMGSTRLFRWGVMDAGRVARAGHDGLRRGRTLVIPGLLNQALAFSVRLSPRILVTKVSGYLQA